MEERRRGGAIVLAAVLGTREWVREGGCPPTGVAGPYPGSPCTDAQGSCTCAPAWTVLTFPSSNWAGSRLLWQPAGCCMCKCALHAAMQPRWAAHTKLS